MYRILRGVRPFGRPSTFFCGGDRCRTLRDLGVRRGSAGAVQRLVRGFVGGGEIPCCIVYVERAVQCTSGGVFEVCSANRKLWGYDERRLATLNLSLVSWVFSAAGGLCASLWIIFCSAALLDRLDARKVRHCHRWPCPIILNPTDQRIRKTSNR
jgi:hypothetical protein